MSITSEPISAEVILKSKSGRSLASDDVLPVSENVEDFIPSQKIIKEVSLKFKNLGFEVSVGSLSITIVGKPVLFEKVFNTTIGITSTKQGTIIKFNTEPIIPLSLANIVETVVFSPSITYLY